MVDSKVVMIEHELEPHKNCFVVNWNLGNKCNFHCSYCIDTLNNGSNPWPNPEIVTRFADAVIENYGRGLSRKIIFTFTGGEVTLYKDLYAILQYLKLENCKTEIISNASPKLSYWEKLKDVLDYAILSFHAEQCRPQHFLEVAQYLHQYLSTHVNIMMHPQRFNECRSLGETIMNVCPNISISFQPLLEKLTAGAPFVQYSAEQFDAICGLNIIREMDTGNCRYRGRMRNFCTDGSEYLLYPEQYVTEGRNQWKGWLCWTGLEQIAVTQWGDVYRAWCFQDKIGDIYGNIRFPDYPVICNQNICHCNMDIMTKKQLPMNIHSQNIETLIGSNMI